MHIPFQTQAPEHLFAVQTTGRAYSTEPFFMIRRFGQPLIEGEETVVAYRQQKHYSIIRIRRGKGVIGLDMESYEVLPEMILLVSPGQLLKLDEGDIGEGYTISFSAEFLVLTDGQMNASVLRDQIFDRERESALFPSESILDKADALAMSMYNEFVLNPFRNSQVLGSFLKILLIYLSGQARQMKDASRNDREKEMTRQFMDLVKQHFLSKKMVVDYAKELCVSPNYLNKIVKRVSGQTASYHIQQQIILEAKRYALYSGWSLKQIAGFLGFNDYAHFSKFFKNNSGMNFTCFKNSL